MVHGTPLCDDIPTSTAQRLLFWSVEFFATLFSSNGDDSDDPLVEVVRRDSKAASLFLRSVMLFSGVGSAIVAIICGAFLAVFWPSCGGCDRPLRWWLLAHTFLQLAQVPVRFVFFARLQRDITEHGTEACVIDFTASPAWKVSKQVSLATYGWFVLGVVWVLNAGTCRNCPNIYKLTVAVIIQAILRAALALGCFRVLFPSNETFSQSSTSQIEGATHEQIADLPVVTYHRCLFDDPSVNCAVCLSEYAVGDSLRRLPCDHYFHVECADTWLNRSKKCPLCMGCIDERPSWEKHKIE